MKYFETQYQIDSWKKFLSLFLFFIIISLTFIQIFGGVRIGSHPAPNGLLIGLSIISLIIVVVFFKMHLLLNITADFIEYQYFPYQLKKRRILFNDISEVYVRKYNALTEFGGWGMKYTPKNGRCFTIQGDDGLQLILNNNKKILIGIKDPDIVESSLTKIKKSVGKVTS